MNKDQIEQLLSLGLEKSIDLFVNLSLKPNAELLIAKARAQVQQKKYIDAIRTIDGLNLNDLTTDLANEYIEIKLTSYLQCKNPQYCNKIIQSPVFTNRVLTPKIELLVAESLILSDSKPSPNHRALPYLKKLITRMPYALELIEKYIHYGGKMEDLSKIVQNTNVKLYLLAVDLANKGDYTNSNKCLQKILEQLPLSIPVLTKLCLNAIAIDDMELFDSTADRIPDTELDIIDLKAARLKRVHQLDRLSQLALRALNTDPNHPNAWLAFSHLLEANGDTQYALQTVKKALLLDQNSRRAYMRHGELRMVRNDIRKALDPFRQAHIISADIDSYTTLVQCMVLLKNWREAIDIAAAAASSFTSGSDSHRKAMILLGIAYSNVEPEKAVRILKQAMTIKPDERALEALVDMKIQEEKYDDAIALLDQYKCDELLKFYTYKMADIYDAKKDYETAIKFAIEAYNKDPFSQRAKELLEHLEGILRDNDEEFGEEESAFTLDDRQFSDF